MIIKNIKMENFRSHRNTSINFNKGITSIIGQNGSGKSSIFQAMNFALFAPRGNNFRIENLMQQGSASFSVELEFEMMGNSYLVKRKRFQNKTDDKLYVNGKLNAESASEINKKMEEILEIDNSVFSNAIYIKQGEIANLIQMTPRDRKEVIGKLLGIEKYEKASEKMNIVKKSYEEMLFKLEGELIQEPEILENLEKLKNEVSESEILKEEILKKYENLEKLKLEKNSELIQMEEKFAENNHLKENLKDVISEIKNIHLEIQNFKNSLSLVVEESKTLSENEENYKKYLELELNIKELNNKLISHKSDYESYNKLKTIEESLIKELNNLEESLKDNKKNPDELKENLKENDEKILILDKIKEKIKELEFIEKQIYEIKIHKKTVETLFDSVKIYDDSIKTFEELKTKKNSYENLLKEKFDLEKKLQNETDEKTKLISELTDLKKIEEKINLENKFKEKYEDLSEKIDKLNEIVLKKESKISETKNSKAELEKTKDSCHVCRSKISEEKKQELLEKYNSEIENEKLSTESLKKQLEIILNKKEQIKVKLNEIDSFKLKYGELKEKKNYSLKVEESIIETTGKLNELAEKISEYSSLNDEISLIENKLKDLENDYKNYNYSSQFLTKNDESEFLNKKLELSKIIGDYDSSKIENEKKSLENLKDELKNIIYNLEREINLKTELKNIQNDISSKIGIVECYVKWEAEKSDFENKLSECKENYEKYMESLAVLKNYSKTYSVEINNLNEFLNQKIAEKQQFCEKLLETRLKIEKNIQTVNYNPELHENAKRLYENILNEFNDILRTLERITSELKLKNENIIYLNKKIQNLANKKEERKKIEEFKEYLDKIKREIFSKDGFQKYLREKYIPLIQRHTNQIFQEFELPYSHIQLKDDYSLIVDGLPVETLSGGEQIAVSLALRLGISKAVCNNIECIILDEPTAYLDEDRRKNLLNIFKNIKTINQMAIITHHQELEQIADNIVKVRKIGENSKVSLE
ncbi:DNA double-strand break repair rad50 ATPase [Methanococcus maripaludis KA1]|uniref:DNA double-strand break repair Rad50 ATPase n=1 Tax=Methanococcus maripaludis KA1 TaxID=637914 RepID=A0A2Z5PU64_METMI|nr:AAA family ATPase [Methanococcus maripaludis]BAP61681.1 DNA double-strand break repair rad50 ATPase [Methanococcus maripaludis KA1]